MEWEQCCYKKQEGEKPIGYASRVLNTAERNYSQTEKEGLAVIYGVVKFYNYLYGLQFEIHTDHKPLLGLFGKSNQTMAGRLQRWILQLNQYEYKLIYKPGKMLQHADGLSRFPVKAAPDQTPLVGEVLLVSDVLDSTPITSKNIAAETKRSHTKRSVLYQYRMA